MSLTRVLESDCRTLSGATLHSLKVLSTVGAGLTLWWKELLRQFVFLPVGCAFLGESRCNVLLPGWKPQRPIAGKSGPLGGALKGGNYHDCRICPLRRVYIFEGPSRCSPFCLLSLPLLPSFPHFPAHQRRTEPAREEKRGIAKGKLSLHLLRAATFTDLLVKLTTDDDWRPSIETERRLRDLVGEGLLRPATSATRPEWIVPPVEHRELSVPKGYVVSFIKFHRHWLESPLSRFMRALLHHYGAELQHLSPNAISNAAIFIMVCEGYLGVMTH